MVYGKSARVGELLPVSGLYASTGRFLVSVLCCIGLVTLPNPTYGQDCCTRIAVPSYVYPCDGTAGCAWDVFKSGASIVIINPNSGPGLASDTSYGAFVDLLNTVKQNSSVTTVLGYVLTGYGNRDPGLVRSDIETYDHIYPQIDGIFLDEGSTSCDTTNLTNYKTYDDLVKASGSFTALNWGTVGTECYLTHTNIDTYVTFEGTYDSYVALTDADLHPAWMDAYNIEKWWHIVYATPNDQNLVRAAVSRAANGLAGYIYFTDDALAINPYNVSPSATVWAAETSSLQTPPAVASLRGV